MIKQDYILTRVSNRTYYFTVLLNYSCHSKFYVKRHLFDYTRLKKCRQYHIYQSDAEKSSAAPITDNCGRNEYINYTFDYTSAYLIFLIA